MKIVGTSEVKTVHDDSNEVAILADDADQRFVVLTEAVVVQTFKCFEGLSEDVSADPVEGGRFVESIGDVGDELKVGVDVDG